MNKKIIVLIIFILIVALGIGGYIINSSKADTKSPKSNTNNTVALDNKIEVKDEIETDKASNNKAVVVYFSATGNTKQIAQHIKDEIDSDIIEIIPKEKYTSEDLNYGDSSTRATREQNDKNARPEIANDIDISNYDVIFLGYPIWWGDVPKIILSFIDNTELDGKTIIPFCTSGSSDISSSENTLKTYDNINWIKGKRFSNNSSKEEIKNWIDGLEIEYKN